MNKNIKKTIRKIIVSILNKLFKKGIKKRIGKLSKKYFFDANFMLSGFEDWGSDHNSGFYKLLEISRNKSAVFDIGAHIGLCTIPLADVVNSGGTVYAFEPAVVNNYYLKRNLSLNSMNNVCVYNDFIGSQSGSSVEFYEAETVSGMNSMIHYKSSLGLIHTQKKQMSLDIFCSEKNVSPEVIKIDVEGAEFDVLKGAEYTLRISKPAILLSVHPKHLKMMGLTTNQLYDFIKYLNYSVFDMEGNATSELYFAEYLLLPIKQINK